MIFEGTPLNRGTRLTALGSRLSAETTQSVRPAAEKQLELLQRSGSESLRPPTLSQVLSKPEVLSEDTRAVSTACVLAGPLSPRASPEQAWSGGATPDETERRLTRAHGTVPPPFGPLRGRGVPPAWEPVASECRQLVKLVHCHCTCHGGLGSAASRCRGDCVGVRNHTDARWLT